jgi:hypothetical protein
MPELTDRTALQRAIAKQHQRLAVCDKLHAECESSGGSAVPTLEAHQRLLCELVGLHREFRAALNAYTSSPANSDRSTGPRASMPAPARPRAALRL